MSEFQNNFKKIQIKSTKVKISEKKALELNNLCILQKNLVYVVGLSPSIAKPEVSPLNKLDSRKERIFWTVRKNC